MLARRRTQHGGHFNELRGKVAGHCGIVGVGVARPGEAQEESRIKAISKKMIFARN